MIQHELAEQQCWCNTISGSQAQTKAVRAGKASQHKRKEIARTGTMGAGLQCECASARLQLM